LEIFDYLSRDYIRIGKIRAIFKAFIFEPKGVEVEFVVLD